MNKVVTVSGAILTGGQSRRMGADKATLKLGNRPLAAWVMAALRPIVGECRLISNQPLLHLRLGQELVIDLLPGRGALGGLLTALFYAGQPLVLLAPCDTPFLQPALLQHMLVRCSQPGVEAVICQSYKGLEPFPGVYKSNLLPRLWTHLAASDYRMRSFLAQCRTTMLTVEEVARLDPHWHSFFNINTAADLRHAAQIAVRYH